MATKKEPEKKPRTPKIVEEPEPTPAFTVTHQEPDKNGARVTIVSGETLQDDNSPVRIKVGEMEYNGGTTVNGFFRAFIPYTEDEITVTINGEVA